MSLAVRSPNLLLPRPGTDLSRWPVVACDQFTSQPDYWAATDRLVGEAPSTLRMILPEVYLGAGDEARIAAIHAAMQQTVAGGVLVPHRGAILVERISQGAHGIHRRTGVVVEVDLDQYDFAKDSASLVRPTEGTIVDRIPPRLRVRAGAPLELPHVLLLFDDRQHRALGPIVQRKLELPPLYDIELMQGGGYLRGYALDEAAEAHLFAALEELTTPQRFAANYPTAQGKAPLQFAVGDGNHSLATARAWWLQVKEKLSAPEAAAHPARWALCEIENIHDAGLEFEPIHRVLFGVQHDLLAALRAEFGGNLVITPATAKQLPGLVAAAGETQTVGLATADGAWTVAFTHPELKLTVATLQRWLDAWLKAGGATGIDYVHGSDVTLQLGSQPGHAGLLLPAIDKAGLFGSVVQDGPLPRKTFSMGEAWEKRYYMECRKIVP